MIRGLRAGIADRGLKFACRNNTGDSGQTRTSSETDMYGGTGACAKCSSLKLLERIKSIGNSGGMSPDKMRPISIVGNRGRHLVDEPERRYTSWRDLRRARR
jgi:hypothetical protein